MFCFRCQFYRKKKKNALQIIQAPLPNTQTHQKTIIDRVLNVKERDSFDLLDDNNKIHKLAASNKKSGLWVDGAAVAP